MDYTDKYIQEIADNLDIGQICFINTDTMEMETAISTKHLDETSIAEEFNKEVYEKVNQWERYIKIEPLESDEAFQIMEDFVEQFIPEGAFKHQVIHTLSIHKPFQNFKFIMESSPYRQEWFDFKLNKLKEHVERLLKMKMDESNKG